MRITFPLLIAAAALSGCANGQYEEQVRAEAQKDLAQALDGYAATGKTSDCVNPRNVSGPQIIGNTTLLYRETGSRIWRNDVIGRSEEHTSELQSLMRNSYAVFCLKKKK